MKYNYFIPLILLIGPVVTEPVPTLFARGDGSCDHTQGTYGNPSCPPGSCCSTYNWCGYGSAWCGPGPNPNPPDGSCDPAQGHHHNPSCPRGACCSNYGWCGYGAPWC